MRDRRLRSRIHPGSASCRSKKCFRILSNSQRRSVANPFQLARTFLQGPRLLRLLGPQKNRRKSFSIKRFRSKISFRGHGFARQVVRAVDHFPAKKSRNAPLEPACHSGSRDDKCEDLTSTYQMSPNSFWHVNGCFVFYRCAWNSIPSAGVLLK